MFFMILEDLAKINNYINMSILGLKFSGHQILD